MQEAPAAQLEPRNGDGVALVWPHWLGKAYRRIDRVTVATGATFTLLYFAISWYRYRNFHAGIDLSLFGQAVKDYAHGSMPYSSIKAIQPFNLLGDHFSPIVWVMAPTYRVFPHIEILLAWQALLLGVSVALVTMLAKRSLGTWRGVGLGCSYGIGRGILDTVVSDFHEVAFAAPLLILACTTLKSGKRAQLIIASILLLLVKEDSAFLIAGFGLCLIAYRRWREGIAYCLAGLVSAASNSQRDTTVELQ
jgi:uncharacterized membrane protein